MISLEQAKLHLRVDHEDEDALIFHCIEAATAAAIDYLNWPETPTENIPAPVESAILLMVGDLYENRERQVDSRLTESKTYQLLLNPYRLMTV